MTSNNQFSDDHTFPLAGGKLYKIDAYWQKCNNLATGMIYLGDKSLLLKPLQAEHMSDFILA